MCSIPEELNADNVESVLQMSDSQNDKCREQVHTRLQAAAKLDWKLLFAYNAAMFRRVLHGREHIQHALSRKGSVLSKRVQIYSDQKWTNVLTLAGYLAVNAVCGKLLISYFS